jgi:hypothetical protein
VSKAFPANFVPLSSIRTSCMDRLAKTRSRIRQTRSQPIHPSISITSTSFEYGSVIVKHLNRRPLASRSWTKSTAYQNPGTGGHRKHDARDGCGFLLRPAVQQERFLSIDPLNPSGDSPSSLPVTAARKSWSSRSVAWSRQSLVSSP